ncbi:MAG: WYL domain-containing protein [Alphaproteobacteria bacterium]|nr:WYL domain-containing protein [Alphaproteobacteria bacterium]
MTRLDRALGILLLLGDGRPITAPALAARFEVSVRTIYRDVDLLSALGVPVYADRGATGGYRLHEGYFLPPVAFTRDEAASLLLALTLLQSLRATPLAAELETASRKLVGVLPKTLHPLLGETRRRFAFEAPPHDAFHPEFDGPLAGAAVARVTDVFLKAVLDGVRVTLAYRTPYRARTGAAARERDVEPLGVLWDRDRWYLVGRPSDDRRPRMWRADRVATIAATRMRVAPDTAFDVRRFLGRDWLDGAIRQWAGEDPVRIRMRPDQAARLRADWYFAHAEFAKSEDGAVLMTIGESREHAFALLRWLGPGAELVAPETWRAELAAELAAMAARHRAR